MLSVKSSPSSVDLSPRAGSAVIPNSLDEMVLQEQPQQNFSAEEMIVLLEEPVQEELLQLETDSEAQSLI